MTVCDQAVHLPLPQLDHAEDQPSAPPAPLHPVPGPRRAAKDSPDPGADDDPAPPCAPVGGTPALNAARTEAPRRCPSDHDGVAEFGRGGPLPQGETAGGGDEDLEMGVERVERYRAPEPPCLRRRTSSLDAGKESADSVPGAEGGSVSSAPRDAREASGKEPVPAAEAAPGSGLKVRDVAGGSRDTSHQRGGPKDGDRGQATAAGARSRDAEVQTVADGALTGAHLSPVVETACQTGQPRETPSDPAASTCNHFDGRADAVQPVPHRPKRPEELHVQTRGGGRPAVDGRATTGVGEGSNSTSGPKRRGVNITRKRDGAMVERGTEGDVLQEDFESFSDQPSVPSPPASIKPQRSQSDASGFRGQRSGQTEGSARPGQETLDRSPGDEPETSQRPTRTPAVVVRRKRPDDEQEQPRRDRSEVKGPGGEEPGPSSANARERGDEFQEHRRPWKNAEVATAEEDKSSGTGNFRFLPDEVPEMQVMVNSLTPVLQRRRSAARRSNSHTGASSSGDSTPCADDLQKLLASFAASDDRREGSAERQAEVDFRQHNQPDRSSAEAKVSSAQRADLRNSDATSQGSSSLFIKPKFARTWHGPVQAGSGRAAAPRMGVAMMTSDAASLALSHGARAGGQAGAAAHPHVHTTPVISRTLLDALHKRYCSYQYSGGGWSPFVPLQPPAAPAVSLTFHLPPQLASAPLKKLNSEGESDTGSSAPTSTQSSPRTPHTTGEEAADAAVGGDEGDQEGQVSSDSSPGSEQVRVCCCCCCSFAAALLLMMLLILSLLSALL